MITATITGKIEQMTEPKKDGNVEVIDIIVRDTIWKGERIERYFWLRVPSSNLEFAKKAHAGGWTVFALCYSVEAFVSNDAHNARAAELAFRSSRLEMA